jgi:hypothetical protein
MITGRSEYTLSVAIPSEFCITTVVYKNINRMIKSKSIDNANL